MTATNVVLAVLAFIGAVVVVGSVLDLALTLVMMWKEDKQ